MDVGCSAVCLLLRRKEGNYALAIMVEVYKLHENYARDLFVGSFWMIG